MIVSSNTPVGTRIRRINKHATYAPIGYETVLMEGDTYEASDGRLGHAFIWENWEVVPKTIEEKADLTIKSDGGSSSYYTLLVAGHTIETEEIIRDVFDNDFDYANAFKSLVRAFKAQRGAGKAGSTLAYELNKIRYSTDKIENQS